MPDCTKCIFHLLGRCPVHFSLNNAACLTLYKDRNTCNEEECKSCRYLKFCQNKFVHVPRDF